MDYLDKAKEVINIEIEGLENVKENLGPSFTDAINLMLECLKKKGKIVVTGIGKNLHIAQKISATLASTGATSVALNPSQAIHGDLGILHKDDVLLALSYSGESEELLAIIPIVKRSGIKVITLTGVEECSLAKHSDIIISAAVKKEACPFNMAPTTSTTATLAVGDAIAMVLLDAQGFGKEDYAKLHPGGAIGRALLLRVSDIMRKDERLAIVSKDAMVKDAVVAMTKARSGSAGVIDSNNKIVGIFTDGDLRRHISEDTELLEHSIESAMTKKPVTITADQLAVDVLHIFEEHNIDDLLVVDEENHIIGAVDIQDLPKLKIL